MISNYTELETQQQKYAPAAGFLAEKNVYLLLESCLVATDYKENFSLQNCRRKICSFGAVRMEFSHRIRAALQTVFTLQK